MLLLDLETIIKNIFKQTDFTFTIIKRYNRRKVKVYIEIKTIIGNSTIIKENFLLFYTYHTQDLDQKDFRTLETQNIFIKLRECVGHVIARTKRRSPIYQEVLDKIQDEIDKYA